MRIIGLCIIHGLFTAYFILCLLYLFYAAIYNKLTWLLLLAIVSLATEGILIFLLNGGNCPLIHLQRRLGDDQPFFELFLPKPMAESAIPLFGKITWLAVGMVTIRLILDWT